MAFIHGHYSDHINTLLTDLADNRISVKWTFESVSKHFALKRPTPLRTPPAKDQSTTRDQPSTNRTQQSGSKGCQHCNNRHKPICWVANPEQAPKGWLQKRLKYQANKSTVKESPKELPTDEPSANATTTSIANYEKRSIWYINYT